MSNNLFTQLQELIRTPPVQLGTVVALTSAGVTVELPGGAQVNVTGAASVSDNVYFQNGVITGAAPSLPIVPIDV